MTAPIGPGDKVICVDARPSKVGRRWAAGEALVEGAIYTVEWAGEHLGEPVLHLAENPRSQEAIDLWGAGVGFHLRRFRPAGRGGMFNDLLTAKPVRVGEDA